MSAAVFTILPIEADQFKPADDPRGLLLHSIYEPDLDIQSLTARALEISFQTYKKRDLANLPVRKAPSYTEAEQSALELWRQQVNYHMTMRISRYSIGCVSRQHGTSVSLAPRPINRTEHQVFQIPELLDLILSFAGPQVQVRAQQVSTNWRFSAMSVISNPKNMEIFRSLAPLPPVEYGQLLDDATRSLPEPDSQQIEQFGLHVDHMISWWRKLYRRRYVYFPAKLAQRDDLPNGIAQSLNELDVGQRHGDYHDSIHTVSRTTDLYWLDLSQFQINPYFDLLFSEKGRMLHRLGRWEIGLRSNATSETLVLGDSSSSEKLLVQAVGSMHITNPPCRSLGIYCYDNCVFPTHGTHILLKRIRNNNGIRVAELLDALQSCAPQLLAKWVKCAEHLRKNVTETGHWVDNVWLIPGTPRFRIHLDSCDMSDEVPYANAVWTPEMARDAETLIGASLGYQAHITSTAYMSAEPPRATKEGEWLPEELFEPMKTECGRSNINWDA